MQMIPLQKEDKMVIRKKRNSAGKKRNEGEFISLREAKMKTRKPVVNSAEENLTPGFAIPARKKKKKQNKKRRKEKAQDASL